MINNLYIPNMLSTDSIGKSLAISLLPIISILTIDHYYSILPFGGIWLVLYILTLFFTTVWLTWIGIQNVLKQNKPFTYDFDQNIYLKCSKKAYLFIRSFSQKNEGVECNKKELINIEELVREQRNIDDRIADFTKDVERLFIMKWYPKISNDETFLKETENLLDNIMRRFLQIVVQIDNKKLVRGILIICLKHVREFRKTMKRQQNTSKSIEELYRYAHIASKNEKAFEHFMCQITTKVFRQFLSWELYNSVPCKCLISILARKLTTYALIYVSTPQTINYKLAQLSFSKENKAKLNLDIYDAIFLNNIDLVKSKCEAEEISRDIKNASLSEVKKLDGNTPNVTPKKIDMTKNVVDVKKDLVNIKKEIAIEEVIDERNEDYDRDEVDTKPHKEVKEVESLHAISEPVKIHKPQSSKTWRNSSDLESISLGQDLLVLEEFNDPDLQIQDLIDKKLWKDNSDSLEVDEKHHPIWNIAENIEEVLESHEMNIPSPNIPSFISNTIKPIGNVTATTLHNMKELQQSTVNNVVKPMSHATSTAMHKIGDLQDEAAGVMEGILDFGMAGIRKGLRLTGLQDNLADKTKLDPTKVSKQIDIPSSQSQQKSHKAGKLMKVPHVSSEDAKAVPYDETVWINPLLKDSPNFDGQILLEKSPVGGAPPVVPTIQTEDTTSPDPEYEDVTDLATTTAKLRSLLQQKTSESNMNTPAVSPLPIDDPIKTFVTPLEYAGRYATHTSSDDVEVDGALPSLYKFCARTATGVFHNTLNTIKTALPGNISDLQEHGRDDSMFDRNWDSGNWMYVASGVGADDFSSRAQRLLNERRAFCTVDNAYEAVESLDVLNQVEVGWNTPTTVYDDELDDLELHIPFTKTLADIFCELVSDTDTFLTQESVVKMLLILFGELSEEYICEKSSKITRNISTLIGKLPNEQKKQQFSTCVDEFTRMVLDVFPSYLRTIVGEEVLISGTQVLITSLQSLKINQDVALQIFELFASLLMEASNKMTPAYSA